MTDKQSNEPKANGAARYGDNRIVVTVLVALVAGMGAMSYAAVPLYQMFCQVTGYGGTTKKAEQAPNKVLDRTITVYFDANTSGKLPWKFKPMQTSITVKIGETAIAHYQATNTSDKELKGTATFNVTPVQTGSYFNKIQCFCFTEQVLKPGETADMPVTFFVDPEIVDDPDAKTVNEITLSYTFFPLEEDGDKGAKGGVAQRPGNQGTAPEKS